MKEFRGSIIALVLLVVVGGLYRMQEAPKETEVTKEQILFRFEKHDVRRVQIEPPSGDGLDLQEIDGKWVIANKNWNANPSMINRIKHQLHDLNARTLVTQQSDNPTLYGLGKNAIRVSLSFAEGKPISFLVGDPNPSAVSYYIQPLPGTAVYTVKKSAMDYFSHDSHAFRNPRFAQFDIKDGQEVLLRTQNKSTLLQRNGVGQWVYPEQGIDIDNDEMRSVLSKVAALKAVRFLDSPQGVLDFGLTEPLLSVRVSLPTEEVELSLGTSFQEGREKLSYVQRKGDPTIYIVRASLEDLIDLEPTSLRNKNVTKVSSKDIVRIRGFLTDEGKETAALIEKKADNWSWDDGALVSGSTPDRLASAIADLRVISFEQEKEDRKETAKIVFSTADSEQVLSIGTMIQAEPVEGGVSVQHYHAWIGKGHYTIDGHLLRVLNDLVREYKRKEESDAKTEALHNRIDNKED